MIRTAIRCAAVPESVTGVTSSPSGSGARRLTSGFLIRRYDLGRALLTCGLLARRARLRPLVCSKCAPLPGNCRPRSNTIRLPSILAPLGAADSSPTWQGLVCRWLSCHDARRPNGQPTAAAMPDPRPSGSVAAPITAPCCASTAELSRSRHVARCRCSTEIHTNARFVDSPTPPIHALPALTLTAPAGTRPRDHTLLRLPQTNRCYRHLIDRPATDSRSPTPAGSP
jgi:hypothetical protein